MAITPGCRLGSYEVVSLLGAGGMGEVYRARDSRLERHVAIKLVLETFVADADRAMRFEREAKTLAALNHPNIATLFGLESADGRLFLVMELVEGDSLAQRITAQPAGMRVEEVLTIGAQIAEALEAAHEKGIIHRDLKPANVKLTADDKVKVLDFGLAKALGDSAGSGAGPGASLMNSPTFTSPAMTQMGVILGTASYMSPEQARGYAADHRADIFSFGVVLYEMLTGRAPFAGETVSDVLAAVLARDPDLAALPADLSPRLVELVKRCLDKNPKKRWQAIGDVRYELEAIRTAPRGVPAAPAGVPAGSRWRVPAAMAATAVATAALVGIPSWYRAPSASVPPVGRFGIHLPESHSVYGLGRPNIAIAPDSRTIAYVTSARQIWVRSLDQLDPKLIFTNTERHPIANLNYSPDGRSLAFWLNNAIHKASVDSGPTTVLATVRGIHSLTWHGDYLYYGATGGLHRLPASGGAPEQVLDLGEEERAYRPQLLADGETLIFGLLKGDPLVKYTETIVAQKMGSKERIEVVASAADPRVIDGRLLYAREGVLFGVRFDEKSLRTVGAATALVEGVRRGIGMIGIGTAQYAVSADGSLVYIPGPKTATAADLVTLSMIDQNGGAEKFPIPDGPYSAPRVSRDGRRIAFVRTEARASSIWMYEVGTSAPRRLTFGERDRFPEWGPDDATVTYLGDAGGKTVILTQRFDRPGAPEVLIPAVEGVTHVPNGWSRDGRYLLFDEVTARGQNSEDVGVRLMVWDTRTRSATQFAGVRSLAMTAASFSPDGRWIAYNTRRESPAQNIVYVQPFPATGALFEISKSSEDGHHAVWSHDMKHLFYTPGPGPVITRVPIRTSPSFSMEVATLLQRPFSNQPTTTFRPFDIMKDGRFLGTDQPLIAASDPHGDFVVVLNWIGELRNKVR